VDTNAKKIELFRKGLTIQLQDRLILSENLSYNELASAAIDQEGTMKACEAAEEKKRKRTVSGPSGGSSSGTPPAPSKWTYSTVKLSYIGVEPSSTALSHVHPHPSSNTTSHIMRTRCVPGSRMR
jgi:hypothetical protein